MNTTFADFLRERAERLQEEEAKKRPIITDWRQAIERLLTQVKEWLRTSDPNGILRIKEDDWELEEEGLGKYSVPRLDIRGLRRWIGIVPKARYTVATAHPPQKSAPERAAGRVDITNEVRRFVLYRFQTADGDVWMIDDQKNPPRVLDQEAFEAALMSYLR